MRGEVHVFLERDGQWKEVQVEKRVGKGKPSFWFVEEPQPSQDQEGRGDQPAPEQESPATEEVQTGGGPDRAGDVGCRRYSRSSN